MILGVYMTKYRKTKRKKLKNRNNVVISSKLFWMLFLTIGLASFKTVINVKGNIKDLKQVVDSKVPTNETTMRIRIPHTIMKDKSSNGNNLEFFGALFTNDGLFFW